MIEALPRINVPAVVDLAQLQFWQRDNGRLALIALLGLLAVLLAFRATWRHRAGRDGIVLPSLTPGRRSPWLRGRRRRLRPRAVGARASPGCSRASVSRILGRRCGRSSLSDSVLRCRDFHLRRDVRAEPSPRRRGTGKSVSTRRSNRPGLLALARLHRRDVPLVFALSSVDPRPAAARLLGRRELSA